MVLFYKNLGKIFMRIYIIFLGVILFTNHVSVNLFADVSDEQMNTQVMEKKSTQSVSVGYGHLLFIHKTAIENTEVNGTISNLGMSIGLKMMERFYKMSTFDAGFSYYISGNTILGFSSTALAEKSKSSSTKTQNGVSLSNVIVLSLTEKSVIKSIAQNITIGINFYSKAPILTTNFGIGPSVNFLFYNLSASKKPRFISTIGLGVSFDVGFDFSVSQLINIPLSIHTAFYPLNFNSFNYTFQYEIQFAFIAAVQLGIAFKY